MIEVTEVLVGVLIGWLGGFLIGYVYGADKIQKKWLKHETERLESIGSTYERFQAFREKGEKAYQERMNDHRD